MLDVNIPGIDALDDLIAATASGNRDAFAELYRRSSAKLYAIALRILLHEESAQDCLQESFLNVWRQAHRYRHAQASAMTWLSAIVRNKAIDMLRQQNRHLMPNLLLPEQVVDMMVDPHDDRIALEKCLAQLAQKQASCLRLAYYSGLTHRELAQQLALPIGTVKTWIRSGLEQLRQCLK